MSILVTGFDRGNDPVNASEVLVNSLRDNLPRELSPFCDQLHFVILPLSTRRVWDVLSTEIASRQPRYCVLTGQAKGRNRVELERLATNITDFDSPDADGLSPRGELIVSDGPAACWSTLPHQRAMVDDLNRCGIPAAMSNYAGNHLCNQVLYRTLHWAQCVGSGLQCGFVHIPPLPQQAQEQWPDTPFMPLDMTRGALERILLLLLKGEDGLS